jgi:DNA-directed RNA polymerase subunit omega
MPWRRERHVRSLFSLASAVSESLYPPLGNIVDLRPRQLPRKYPSEPFYTAARTMQKSFDKGRSASHIPHFVTVAMLGSRLFPNPISSSSPTILQFPANPSGAVHTLRIMTTQLLQEASQIIPNPQLLINVVSKRVRQLGLGHRPMVEVGPRASLTDIALKEIIAGKLSFEEQSASTDGA